MSGKNTDPHVEGGILTGGRALREASRAMILLHGRGGSATEMIRLGQDLGLRGTAMLAPQAVDRSWYPNGFLAPITSNEPWLNSAMKRIRELLTLCAECEIPMKQISLVGFAQGACLALEYIVRYPQEYGAVIAFTGGLLGPLGSDLARPGSLGGTSVLLSSGDPDRYVPWSRVEETADQLRIMNATVVSKRIPGHPHEVLSEDLDLAQTILCSASCR